MRAYTSVKPKRVSTQPGERPIFTMQLTVITSIKRFHWLAVYRNAVRRRFRVCIQDLVGDSDPSLLLCATCFYVIMPSQRSLRIDKSNLRAELAGALRRCKSSLG